MIRITTENVDLYKNLSQSLEDIVDLEDDVNLLEFGIDSKKLRKKIDELDGLINKFEKNEPLSPKIKPGSIFKDIETKTYIKIKSLPDTDHRLTVDSINLAISGGGISMFENHRIYQTTPELNYMAKTWEEVYDDEWDELYRVCNKTIELSKKYMKK